MAIFVDMFYLPFEHGRRGIQMLQEFSWLHENSYVMRRSSDSGIDDQVIEFSFFSVFISTTPHDITAINVIYFLLC